MKKNIVHFVVLSLLLALPVMTLAKSATSSDPGLTPDSQFYFLKIWKENIQTFFIFNAEQKARQYLHLADVRMAEYEKMVEKGKTAISQKTLDKYEKQLNRAIQKAEELKSKGKDVKDVFEKIAATTAKHITVLENNLQKVPESAKKGIERALENAKRVRKAEDETAGLSGNLDEKFDLRFGKTLLIESEGLKVQFSNVTEDSRCPSGVQCVQAGQAGITLLITKDNLSRGYRALISGPGDQDSKVIDGVYLFKLIKVEPYPQSGKAIDRSDYVVTLLVSKNLNSEEVADWRVYRDEKYKFEVNLPPKKEMLYDEVRTYSFYRDSKYEGIYLGEFLNNGCSFHVLPNIDDGFISLLKEDEKERGYPLFPLSETVQSRAGKIYYVGFAIASRAVDVSSCKPLFDQMLSNFKLLD